MNRKINNTIAFGIVATFLILPFSAMAADPIVTETTYNMSAN